MLVQLNSTGSHRTSLTCSITYKILVHASDNINITYQHPMIKSLIAQSYSLQHLFQRQTNAMIISTDIVFDH